MARASRTVAVLRTTSALRMASAVLCAAALLGGCSVGPSQRPPVAVRGNDLPPAAAPIEAPATVEVLPEPERQDTSLPFYDCTAETLAAIPAPADRTLRVECGELTVVADPAQPGLGGTTLGVVRIGLADAPDDRPPLLALGDSAGESSARHAVALAGQVSPALLGRYTLIGLDRRGAGYDTLDCAPLGARAALLDADPAATGEADLTDLLERARSVVQECTIALDGGLGTYRTASTAADVEYLRGALGVERLSAVGTGDGAAALADWTRTFPQAVGRLVLDGPPAPGIDDPDLSESRAAGAEAAFDAFALSCTATAACPLGPDPRATVTGLVQALRDRPQVSADGRRLTAGSALVAVLGALGEPARRPALAAALAAVGTGDPTALLDLHEPLAGPRGRFDAQLATSCNDTSRRSSPGQVAEIADRWRTAYPLFGGTFALHLMACAPWPTGGTTPVAGAGDGAPPILVLGTAADPRSSQDGARRAAEAITPARFLSWQGSAAGAYPRTACVSAIVDAMLVDGVVPQGGALCPP